MISTSPDSSRLLSGDDAAESIACVGEGDAAASIRGCFFSGEGDSLASIFKW